VLAPRHENDTDLARIVAAWPALPAATRRAMLALLVQVRTPDDA
jgi:hypothetical protein